MSYSAIHTVYRRIIKGGDIWKTMDVQERLLAWTYWKILYWDPLPFVHHNIYCRLDLASTSTYFSLSCTLMHTRGLDHDYFFFKNLLPHIGRLKLKKRIAKLSTQKWGKPKKYLVLFEHSDNCNCWRKRDISYF